MPKFVTRCTHSFKIYPLRMPTFLLFVMILAGCASSGANIVEERSSGMQSIVVVGFAPVLSVGEEPGVVRSPLGTVYMANPVSQEICDIMTESLYSKLSAEKRYVLVSPGQAKGVLGNLLASNPGMDGISLYQRVGKGLSADGVLVGFLYRWIEREGADYAVNRPASVGFDLYLVRSADGAVVWKGRFDKTQQSFFENVLDFHTFVKSGGKWAKAETLSEMGLTDLLEKFPKGTLEKETKE